MGRPFRFHSRERGAGIDEGVNSLAATACGAAVFDDPILSATTRWVARTADEGGIVTLLDGRTFHADDHGQSAVDNGQGAGGSDARRGSRSVVSASRGRAQGAVMELSTCQGSEAHADLTDSRRSKNQSWSARGRWSRFRSNWFCLSNRARLTERLDARQPHRRHHIRVRPRIRCVVLKAKERETAAGAGLAGA